MQKTLIFRLILAVVCIIIFSAPAIAGYLTFVEVQKRGVNGVEDFYFPRSVSASPDGKNLYVACIASNTVAVFSRDTASGQLTFVENQKDGVNGVDGLGGANSVRISPDGKHVYVAGWYDSAIAVFSRNATSGLLTFTEFQKDGVNGVDGLMGTSSVTVSSDGKHVYATGGQDSAVAVFGRDTNSGQLTFVEYQKDGVNGVDGIWVPSCVTVSPDGKHVYVTGEYDDAVAVFSRDANTGQLIFVEYQEDGVNGVDGLDYPYSVAVSFDGKNVYTSSSMDDAVAVFNRDATSGKLTFVQYQMDGVNGIEGLDGAHGATVSPDGKHVYATGRIDDAVAVFSRDTASGQLIFVENEKDDVNGVDGLDDPYGITVSPDGKHVYVTGNFDDSVAVFKIHQDDPNPPTVTTGPTLATGKTTATSGGNVTADGGTFVNTRGICWSTSPNPTILDNKEMFGSGTGTFTSPITGLYPMTTYHVRAYATNSVGTSYGNDVTITTEPFNIFGMEEGNQWVYNDGITETVEELDPASYYPREYWVKIYENNSWIGSRMYGITGEELKLWTYGDSGLPMGFAFDNGLTIAWYPITVGEERSSTANEVNYPGTVTSNAQVMGYEEVQLDFDTLYAYKIHLIITVSTTTGTSTLSMDNWFLPYIGFIKSEAAGIESTLVSFALGGGTITETSDNDNDDLLDYQELAIYSTNPNDSDSDDDGFTDGDEVNTLGTDPNNPNSHPSTAMPWIPLLLLDY